MTGDLRYLEVYSQLHYHMLYSSFERSYNRACDTGVLLAIYASTTSLEVLNPSSLT